MISLACEVFSNILNKHRTLAFTVSLEKEKSDEREPELLNNGSVPQLFATADTIYASHNPATSNSVT